MSSLKEEGLFFLSSQTLLCFLFIIYFTLIFTFGNNAVVDDSNVPNTNNDDNNYFINSFLERPFYFDTISLLLGILLPILMFFTVFSSTIKKKENNNSQETSLLRSVILFTLTLIIGSIAIFCIVLVFGFTPFLKLPTSSQHATVLLQSARREKNVTLSKDIDIEAWNKTECAAIVPLSMFLSVDNYVFQLGYWNGKPNCFVMNLDELKCCILWCVLTCCIVIILPMSTLVKWKNMDTLKLVLFEKSARISSVLIDFRIVNWFRNYLLTYCITIWISAFVIPLDWDVDWQYFPICTTIGLIIGCFVNTITSWWRVLFEKEKAQ
ncbi:hypothetical protein ABK040_007148 [Willaertia magna]